MDPREVMRQGDALIYRAHSLFGYIISLKTWFRASHVEAYFGRGWSIGCREGRGVAFYDFNSKHLARILRPSEPFDVEKAMCWYYRSAEGQKYDYLGLLCFTLAAKHGSRNKMWCSEFMTRWYRAGGFNPFSTDVDADRVAPAQFVQSPLFSEVWSDGRVL